MTSALCQPRVVDMAGQAPSSRAALDAVAIAADELVSARRTTAPTLLHPPPTARRLPFRPVCWAAAASCPRVSVASFVKDNQRLLTAALAFACHRTPLPLLSICQCRSIFSPAVSPCPLPPTAVRAWARVLSSLCLAVSCSFSIAAVDTPAW